MSWKANAKIQSISSVGTVTLKASGEDITCTGDDQVTVVEATVVYADASHLKEGDTLAISGDC